MRVMIIGRSKRLISAESGLYAAMKRMGHSVILVDDRRLRQRIGRRAANQWIRLRFAAFRPERVLVFKPHDVEPEVMAEITSRTPTTMWYRDLTIPPDPELVIRARMVDTLFLTAGGQAATWEAAGARKALWLPDGADRDMNWPTAPDPRFACDVAFMGRGVWPGPDYSRAEFLVRLSKRFDVRVWGQEWERWAKDLKWDGTAVYGQDFARVCASAKVIIDVKPALWTASDAGVYSSNRLVRQLSCAGFSLSRGTKESKEMFREGEHCIWYDSEDEAFEKIAYYLENDAERRRIAEAGAKLVHDHHMLDNRVHNLLTGEPYRDPLSATP